MTVTVAGGVVSGSPLIEAVIIAVVAVMPRNVDKYVPSSLSSVGASVPSLAKNETTRPPVRSEFPSTSVVSSVTITESPAASVSADARTVDVSRETSPGLTRKESEIAGSSVPAVNSRIRGPGPPTMTRSVKCAKPRTTVVVSAPTRAPPPDRMSTVTTVESSPVTRFPLASWTATIGCFKSG